MQPLTMMLEPQHCQATPAIAPYRDPSHGDAIIRSSDDAGFHVYKRRIADISSVFSDIFSLPITSKPVINVSETSKVWKKLLPICHLDEEPTLTLEDVRSLYEAGRKYIMVGVMSRMKVLLSTSEFLDQKPFVVYALACLFNVPSLPRSAAKRTLLLPVFPADTPDFSSVSGRAVYQLLDYRRRCGSAAQAAVTITPGKYTLPAFFTHNVRHHLGTTCGLPDCEKLAPVISVRYLALD
ncbi:hypothetical protein C8Q74DRAFT_1234071 [Fomes fomentarius]|nr:hypothetical protein C8Q74DRAFT_1234071 [Fomes fomentarius]